MEKRSPCLGTKIKSCSVIIMRPFRRRKRDDLRLDSKQIVVNHGVELGSGAFASVYMATLLLPNDGCLTLGAGKSIKRIVAAKVCKDTDESERYALKTVSYSSTCCGLSDGG